MAQKLVYLSGPMDGVTREEGNNWRKFSTDYLLNHNIITYNPYTGCIHDEKTTANEVFSRDIYYLDKSDIVLVNLDLPETIQNTKMPFFTIGEMFLAHRMRKPIVAYTNCLKGRFGYDAIVTKSLDNLADSLDFIVTNYGQ